MKIWILDRKLGFTYCLIAILLVSFVYLTQNKNMFVSNTKKEVPICCVEKEEKEISISFDTGKGEDEELEKIIETLDKNNIKSTFFVVGSWLDTHEEKTKKIFEKGHEIMNHTENHKRLSKCSVDEIKKEIEKCEKKIGKMTGKKPDLLRTPYGDYNNDVLQIAKEMGYSTIKWNIDSMDWKDGATVEEIKNRIVNNASPGSIILLHAGLKITSETLPIVIEELKQKDYKIVPISELMHKNNYTIDKNGVQKRMDNNKKNENSSNLNSGEAKKVIKEKEDDQKNDKKPLILEEIKGDSKNKNTKKDKNGTDEKRIIKDELKSIIEIKDKNKINEIEKKENTKNEINDQNLKDQKPQQMGQGETVKQVSANANGGQD